MSGEAVRRDDLLRYRQPFFQRQIGRAMELVSDALSRMTTPAVAFSGGKDSLVVAAMVARIAPGTPAVWCDDELEYPDQETYIPAACAALGLPLTVLCSGATHAGWFRAWQDPPYWRAPLPSSVPRDATLPNHQYAAAWMRRAGFDGTFRGLRQDESQVRKMSLRHRGPLGTRKSGMIVCDPLSGWRVDDTTGRADVWALIAGWELPYNPTYDVLASIGVPRRRQRVGPLPLSDETVLRCGWPDLHHALIERYGSKWYG